ncbi:MAG: twin-arginine translocase subunit TatC [Gemmatimonadetes bacterium]|nr:twin-arginine translocase subunit TatC [Gemmatimonadota bacterium]
MARSTGEMPFLDHLEELRSRIIKALVALIVGIALGLFLVEQFRLVDILQAPILPLLGGRKLAILAPTDAFMIFLKLGFIGGVVLASPVLIWQAWAFLSPALYDRERKTLVPALFVGMALFLAGSIASFVYIVPPALKVLLSFQSGSFEMAITFEKYFSFVLQVVLAMGLSAELPLLIVLLAILGIVNPQMLSRFRRYAVLGAFFAGAMLSPGGDVLTMLLMTAPLLVLYEIGYLGAVVVHRRRLRASAATTALLLLLAAIPVQGQRPPPRPPGQPARPAPQAQQPDTGRVTLDAASAKRLGIPTAPKLSFPANDSIIDQLLELEGFEITRYRSDTARVAAIDRQVQLDGNAMTERAGSTLEARAIFYREGDCRFEAEGDPRLFQGENIVVGRTVKFDTCIERGLVREGRTTFPQQGANWIISGQLAVDSAARRVYASAREVTSCDLPESHYHFSAKELKWVSQSTMVARPAVLYIRDVPIAWIPFLFQDTKRGRRSGILIPEFGFNDIVRPSRSFNRTIRNLGYYWAPNDYIDVLGRFDWFSNRYLEFGLEGQYRFIDRFARGAVSLSRSKEVSGGSSMRLVWNHSQTFDVTTKLNWSIDYSTNSSIVRRNAIDPRLTTQQIRSSGTYSKQFAWGNLSLGFNRSQNVNDGSVTQTLPSLSISPKPFDFGPNFTWSPDLNYSRDQSLKQPAGTILIPRGPGQFDSLKLTEARQTQRFSMNTPLRLWGLQWQNSISLIDVDSSGVRSERVRIPDESTPDPTDSITVVRTRTSGFGSEFDWQTSFNLPILFRTSWKLTPSVGVTNTTSGAFAVRNERTNGQFVRQSKRLQFGLSLNPTFYGFFGGLGPLSRIRHTIQPSLTYSYSPARAVPLEYARAVARPGEQLRLTSLPTQSVSLTLNQNFEAKTRRPAGDTTDLQVRKIRLLSISTSPLSYDFEQAKEVGRTGWTTSSISNSVLSDLVPGLNLAFTHDLWIGAVGSDTARFSPFLSGVTASFSLTEGTFRSIGRLLGLASAAPADGRPPTQPTAQPPIPGPFGDLRRGSAFTANQTFSRGQRGFNASVNLTINRNRPVPGQVVSPNRSNISLNTSFAPTPFWQVNWTTQYDAANKQFEAQQLNLTRDLHDWRATFTFLRNPNGNFSFSFLISLIDLPDLKFDYRQSTIQDRR